eukprot:jgi/Tetstr1/454855/TSEL_004043.t1
MHMEHMEIDFPEELVHCEYCATGAVKSCTRMLDDFMLVTEMQYKNVCSVAFVIDLNKAMNGTDDDSDSDDRDDGQAENSNEKSDEEGDEVRDLMIWLVD